MKSLRQPFGAGLLGGVCSLLLGLASPSLADLTLATPAVSGHQLLYIFDARPDRRSFLTVANPANESVLIEIVLYPSDLSTVLAQGTVWLESGANRVVDPKEFDGGGADGNAGLAVVTPILSEIDPKPIVPPQPLVGGFTLANLALGSGFGQNPFARFAVDTAGENAAPRTMIDGVEIAYQRFAPGTLTIPVYFDPDTLGPPEDDGNRILLASFADEYTEVGFSPAPLSRRLEVRYFGRAGQEIARREVDVSGILLSDLEQLAGGANLSGSSGKVFLRAPGTQGNFFGLFGQSQQTYAAGQRLPAVENIPVGLPDPVATPTPAPSECPNPLFCSDPDSLATPRPSPPQPTPSANSATPTSCPNPLFCSDPGSSATPEPSPPGPTPPSSSATPNPDSPTPTPTLTPGDCPNPLFCSSPVPSATPDSNEEECVGEWLSAPMCVGSVCYEPGANGSWYGLRNIQLDRGETKSFCAPVSAPLVPEAPWVVQFELFNDYERDCGAALIRIDPPHPTQEPYESNASFAANKSYAARAWDPETNSFDIYGNPDNASRGTYKIELYRPTWDQSDACNSWRLGWRTFWG